MAAPVAPVDLPQIVQQFQAAIDNIDQTRTIIAVISRTNLASLFLENNEHILELLIRCSILVLARYYEDLTLFGNAFHILERLLTDVPLQRYNAIINAIIRENPIQQCRAILRDERIFRNERYMPLEGGVLSFLNKLANVRAGIDIIVEQDMIPTFFYYIERRAISTFHKTEVVYILEKLSTVPAGRDAIIEQDNIAALLNIMADLIPINHTTICRSTANLFINLCGVPQGVRQIRLAHPLPVLTEARDRFDRHPEWWNERPETVLQLNRAIELIQFRPIVGLGIRNAFMGPMERYFPILGRGGFRSRKQKRNRPRFTRRR